MPWSNTVSDRPNRSCSHLQTLITFAGLNRSTRPSDCGLYGVVLVLSIPYLEHSVANSWDSSARPWSV